MHQYGLLILLYLYYHRRNILIDFDGLMANSWLPCSNGTNYEFDDARLARFDPLLAYCTTAAYEVHYYTRLRFVVVDRYHDDYIMK